MIESTSLTYYFSVFVKCNSFHDIFLFSYDAWDFALGVVVPLYFWSTMASKIGDII
jgi:hypothetical protein